MSCYPHQARVLLATLSECVSGGGNPYLRGWAGTSNLVAFRGEPDEQGRPTWNLFLVERLPRQEPPARRERRKRVARRSAARQGMEGGLSDPTIPS